MGNRAIIKPIDSNIGVYLHWNGGVGSVTGFLKYCEMRDFRPFGGDHADGYGLARFCQVVGNFFGGTLNLGICKVENDENVDGLDNGIYIVDGWAVVKNIGHPCKDGYGLTDMLLSIDKKQPESEQLGEDYITAEEVPITEIKVGDKVFWFEGYTEGSKPELYTVTSIAPQNTFCNGNVSGLPHIDKYEDGNPNNYLRGHNGKLRRLMLKYKVRYSDNTGIDETLEYDTKAEAENAIEEELKSVKESYKDFDYDYGDFGNTTKFWVCNSIEYSSWERLYE